MTSDEITVATIISKNYLAYARTFTDSFLKNNPNGKVFVLLVDQLENYFDSTNEKFTLVKIDEIGIENLESFCFKYSILERNTGGKAHFLKYLFEKYKLEKLAYFDPDILFTNSLENLWKVLDKKSIVLTPHLLAPLNDNKIPSELEILKAGCYNLGFIALSNTETTHNFLQWWIPHLMDHGYSDVNRGMFTDQKWIDLVPALFDDVYIIRHPGYNVAYWNLGQRDVKIINDKMYVDEKPMYFFHFSGFEPENMEKISKYQNRFSLKDLKKIRSLFELYRDLLIENGFLESKQWKSRYDYFDNGIRIPDAARKIFAESSRNGSNFGNPFSTTGSQPFIEYLNENVDHKEPIITRFWHHIYNEREDLKKSFPDLLGKDRYAFLNWAEQSLENELKIDQAFFPIHVLKKRKNNHENFSGSSSSITSKEFETQADSFTKSNYLEFGINVAGYLKGEFGIGQSVRNYVNAIKNAGIPCVLNNIITPEHRHDDTTFEKFQKENPYPINLVVVNADLTKYFFKEMGLDYFKNKYNIGLWAWELEKFPENFVQNSNYYDEIWTISDFTAKSLQNSISTPVVKITTPIEIDESKLIRNKQKFGLNQNDFVFLFIFDFESIFERKNPLATIAAFKKAFDENSDAKLILKSINGSKNPSAHKKLQNACDRKNIIIIDEHFEKSELLSLLASCDCYVSLHRSEGFGLTIAEAMYSGKPVIATNYGGNVDFMNKTNSFPVKYEIVELERDYVPYYKGNVWAEPDVDEASKLMKYVFDNQNVAKKIGENA